MCEKINIREKPSVNIKGKLQFRTIQNCGKFRIAEDRIEVFYREKKFSPDCFRYSFAINNKLLKET